MMIAVNFVTARQEWNPDTGKQQNFMVMEFAGRNYTFEVTEAELVHAIQTARASGVGPEEETDGGGEDEPGEDDAYYGEDVPVEPPAMFKSDTGIAMVDISTDTVPVETTRTRELLPGDARRLAIAERRPENPARAKLQEMRKRAVSVPMRRVPKDDMGYPIVQQTAAPQEPTVTRHVRAVEREMDEDGFGQA